MLLHSLVYIVLENKTRILELVGMVPNNTSSALEKIKKRPNTQES